MTRHKPLFFMGMLVGGLLGNCAYADNDGSRPRVRLGGVVVDGSYTSGPGWYGPWGYGSGFYQPWWGLYDPFWTSAYVHPALYGGFVSGPNMGQVKLNAPKDASVYLDGAFAGSVEKLKSIPLEPGIYELKISGANGSEYHKKIYVLSGKTLNIRAELKP